jgi:hypothetical protein
VTSIPEPARKRSSPLLVAALFVLLIGAVVVGAWLVTRDRTPQRPILNETPVTTASATTSSASTTTPSPIPSATTLEVVPTTTTATPVLTQPITPTTTAATATTPPTTTTRPPVTQTVAPVVPRTETREEPAPSEENEPADRLRDVTFFARGDDDHNDQVLEHLRESLRGTRRVAVRGGDMHSELVTKLKDEFPWLEISNSANVVIDFDGSIGDLRGRKTRAARATVRKNGRVIFRYVLEREIYRIGHDPVEGFISALGNAFEE